VAGCGHRHGGEDVLGGAGEGEEHGAGVLRRSRLADAAAGEGHNGVRGEDPGVGMEARAGGVLGQGVDGDGADGVRVVVDLGAVRDEDLERQAQFGEDAVAAGGCGGGDERRGHQPSVLLRRTETKASWGTLTVPHCFMRFLPSFCLLSSFCLRVTSPP